MKNLTIRQVGGNQRTSPVFTTPSEENCYVIFGVSITVASIRRDEVNLSKFIGELWPSKWGSIKYT